MKIVHICLGCFYVENMGYQENILPRYHIRQGHQVTVLTSDYAFNAKGENVKKTEKDYVNKDGIRVKVLQRANSFMAKFGIFEGLYNQLTNINPDVIFVHGGQFLSLNDVIKYAKYQGNVKVFIDQHADYYNSPVSTLKARVVHGLLYGHYMRKAVKYVEKYWGVTPWRCQYLKDVYRIPAEKIDLLIMGGDDDLIDFDNQEEIRCRLRNELGISNEDFVIITGGKIDRTKNIHLLMDAIRKINNDKIKLVIFGQPNGEMENVINSFSNCKNIISLGWLPAEKVYNYFLMADLAVFPGTHSVLWEQACACGLPGLFKDWEGMRHVLVNGNAILLTKDSCDEIKTEIENLVINTDKFSLMKDNAQKYKEEFFYSKISKRAIGID